MAKKLVMNDEHGVPQQCVDCMGRIQASIGQNIMLALYCPNCATFRAWKGGPGRGGYTGYKRKVK